MKPNQIAIGCDHRGFVLKEALRKALQAKGYQVKDFGTDSEASCDYPDFAIRTALAVQKGECERGIVICNTGMGVSIAANKVKGVRASLCGSVEAARLARQHNDANVLALGAGFVDPALARDICFTWLETPFEGGRHERRIEKISVYEKGNACGSPKAKS